MSDDVLYVAQVAAPRCDPAFDRADPEWGKRSAAYVRARSAVRLDTLPRKADGEGRPRQPRLWAVGWLSPAAYALLRAEKNVADRQQLAFRVGCHSRIEPDGRVVRAPIEQKAATSEGASIASMAWLNEAVRLGGHQLVAEVAEVVLRRHEIGDLEDDGGEDLSDPFDRHQLPAGLVLAR